MSTREGKIATFYSYKGGVGRSMALANVGYVLAKWGYKTLLIDWDLEAPGLEKFFLPSEEREGSSALAEPQVPYLPTAQKGLIDLLEDLREADLTAVQEMDFSGYCRAVSGSNAPDTLELLWAGNYQSPEYYNKIRQFEVKSFYAEAKGGQKIEYFRQWLTANYDFVLIDSRTGVTDFGGMCTIQMPDYLFLLYAGNNQNLQGVLDIGQRAKAAHQQLPYDRMQLLTVPIFCRAELNESYQLRKFLEKSAATLSPLLQDWLPDGKMIKEWVKATKIQYVPAHSYEESIVWNEQDTFLKSPLVKPYQDIAALIGNAFERIPHFFERSEDYIFRADRSNWKTIHLFHDEADIEQVQQIKKVFERHHFNVKISIKLDELDFNDTQILNQHHIPIVLLSQNLIIQDGFNAFFLKEMYDRQIDEVVYWLVDNEFPMLVSSNRPPINFQFFRIFWNRKYNAAIRPFSTNFQKQSQSSKYSKNQTFAEFKSQINADYHLLMKMNILDLHDLITGDYEYFKELHDQFNSSFMY